MPTRRAFLIAGGAFGVGASLGGVCGYIVGASAAITGATANEGELDLEAGLAPGDLERLLRGEHSDPHRVLGAHPARAGGWVVRAFHPDAEACACLLQDAPALEMQRLRPGLFAGKNCSVAIETQSELTMGMTVVDWWNVTPAPANCRVINAIDAAGFYALIRERLALLP